MSLDSFDLYGFKMYYSQYANKIENYRKTGLYELLIKLIDGRFILYFEMWQRIWVLDIDPDNLTEEDCRKIFALRVRYRLYLKSMTQEDLSNMTGISRLMINRYLVEDATPSWYNVCKIAHALECKTNDLQFYW